MRTVRFRQALGATMGALLIAATLGAPQIASAVGFVPFVPVEDVLILEGNARPGGVLTVRFAPGQTFFGNTGNATPFDNIEFFDLFLCPNEDAFTHVDHGFENLGCVLTDVSVTDDMTVDGNFSLDFRIRVGDPDNPPADALVTDAFITPEELAASCGASLHVNAYPSFAMSNWLVWNCTPAASVAAAHPMELECTPDPVVPGGTVTCVITSGDPGIDILWRASFGGSKFVERGVTLGPDGRGTFSFVAPGGAQGQAISVELVEWSPTASVQVTGTPLPTRLPAGEGPLGVPLGLSLGALVLVGAGVLRLRRAGAMS